MANDEAELWGKWLTDRMTEAGIDAKGLIDRSGGKFGKVTVYQWMRGLVCPGAEMTLQVAEILGVPEAEALGASGHLKVAGVMSKLATASGDDAGAVDGPLREILGFEHLPDGLKASLIENYRASMEAAQERAREIVERWQMQREKPES